MVVGDGMSSFPILMTKKPGVSFTTWGARTQMTTTTTTPPRPPPKTTVTPRGGRGAGTTTVPDDDVTAAAASRDAVATNATNAIGPRGARDLRAGAETETW